MRMVLDAAVGQAVVAADPAAVPILGRFSGVYVYDGSVVSLPPRHCAKSGRAWAVTVPTPEQRR